MIKFGFLDSLVKFDPAVYVFLSVVELRWCFWLQKVQNLSLVQVERECMSSNMESIVLLLQDVKDQEAEKKNHLGS